MPETIIYFRFPQCLPRIPRGSPSGQGPNNTPGRLRPTPVRSRTATTTNFPASQKFTYPVEPPLWDRNWDGLKDRSVSRKKGVTRHVILVRHGQYDETHKDDARRILTELGRRQAKKTGERLAELIKAAGPGSLKVRALRSR